LKKTARADVSRVDLVTDLRPIVYLTCVKYRGGVTELADATISMKAKRPQHQLQKQMANLQLLLKYK
jgi:hypothetical protein